MDEARWPGKQQMGQGDSEKALLRDVPARPIGHLNTLSSNSAERIVRRLKRDHLEPA